MPGSNLESRDTASTPESQVRTMLMAVAHSLLSKDLFSGWGIRTVATGESRYNPISYHNGSILAARQCPDCGRPGALWFQGYGWRKFSPGLLAVSTFC